MTRILNFILIFAFFSSTAFSYSWPNFETPSIPTLKKIGIIDKSNCPFGFAKIKHNQQINIRKFTCKTFCPTDWHWISESNETCIRIENQFKFLKFDIFHSKENGENRSEVIAYFGNQDNKVMTKFRFIVNQNYYCIEDENASISCANDS